MNDFQLLLWFLFISAGIVLTVIKINAYYKAKQLRELAYDIAYYYMTNCCNIDYFQKKKLHLSHVHKDNYEQLVSEINNWYLNFSSNQIIQGIIDLYDKASELTKDLAHVLNKNHYFAYSEYERIIVLAKDVDNLMDAVNTISFRSYIQENIIDKNYTEPLKLYRHDLLTMREQHNREFVKKELNDNKEYFDNLLTYPLDQQQREAIVKLEDNCLVIASAGSGKTSTSIAKVKYLIEKRRMEKDKILVLSYNRKTAEEFQQRLNIEGLTCKTFHALALSIIAKVRKERPDICEDKLLVTCFYNLVRKNEDYKTAVVSFFSTVSFVILPEHDYEEATTYYEDREKYGIMAPYGDMNGSPVITRSEEERKICCWLSEHGVRYLYEQPYPINTANIEHRQYKPDFTIYFKDEDGKTKMIFLEHFGIDRYGNVPRWFGDGKRGGFEGANWKYNQDIEWKRNIHRKNKTVLLETTSAMFHDNTVFEKLEKQLTAFGIPCKKLDAETLYQNLIVRDKFMEDNVMTLLSSFINLMKSNGKSFEDIMDKIKKSDESERFINRCDYLIYKVIKPLYEEYQNTLKEKGQMDFTDIILEAADLCENGKYKTPYKYILVDEFQDISVDRYRLVRSLRKPWPLTKLFCVGDDWQSIYRFAGSDMNLFAHFENYFGFTEKCKIETTYRFGNPLVAISTDFILKNPVQVKKTVRPFSEEIKTELSFIPFQRNRKDFCMTMEKILNRIPADESVLLLGRYNFEVNFFPRECITLQNDSKKAKVTFQNRTMDFMSVHSGKGLEADNVIILNCSQDKGGFPSRVSEDPILGYVLSEIDDYEYSEERRLFYVGITRAKKHAFVMYNQSMPSAFVTEIIQEQDENQLTCPKCKKGRLNKISEGKDQIYCDIYYHYRCSNTISGCNYSWYAYFDEEDENPDVVSLYHKELDQYFNEQPPETEQPPEEKRIRRRRKIDPPMDIMPIPLD